MSFTWAQGDLSTASSAPAGAGDPWGYTFDAQGTQHVNYCGPNNHVCELWWDTNGWHFADLTADAAGAPSTASNPRGYVFAAQGTRHVNYLGPDGHVHELWWDVNGWHHNDLTATAGAPTGVGNPGGYVFDSQGTQHVNYLGGDGHVHELWWDARGWHHNDLTVAAGAPNAAGDPFGYMFDARGTQHVNYLGTDGHVHELHWDAAGWHHNDLTAAAGSPDAAGDPFGYMFDSQGTQHVDYLGTDGHVHELWWDINGWHHNDLTAATGAPASASNPRGYVFVAQNTQHVNYCDADGHVHELWWDTNGWQHNDLTAEIPAETAQGAPVGYMFAAQGTQHINYLGSDFQIHELWWPGGCVLSFEVASQKESEWCWAAVSTSVAHYYAPASTVTQCEVVNEQLGRTDCCTNPSSSNCNQSGYLDKALQYLGNLAFETGQGDYGNLFGQVAAGTPPCIRIAWSGGGGHFIGVYGCQGNDLVMVTDPIYGDSIVAVSTLTGGTYEGSGTWTDTYYTKS
ncbi:MAG: hypothetical protein JO190_12315 [Candidatus Eremiobacteraeota bacterium]|nr:hypothetical protein [Candidatus Eremiobacteraeota bacterium]MBV8498585.1 hypothetical protein [Candidatus Eremiobacteraeota bacterium]